MGCRLKDFALVVLTLLMFKVCGIIGISGIEFFNVSGTERVEQNKKHKNHSGPFNLKIQSLLKHFQQILNMFLVLH